MLPLLLLAACAVGLLAAGRLADRLRLPAGLPAGVGLVLLLVAAVRGLDGAVTALDGGSALSGLAVALGVLGGAALRWSGRAELPVAVAAVVLAHVGLLVAYGRSTYDVPVDAHLVAGPPVLPLVALAGLLAGGALAALRPGGLTAAVAVAALVGVLAGADLLGPAPVSAATSGAAAAVLVPVLLERARAASGPRLAEGALLGLALVLLVAAVPRLVEGTPEPVVGLQALSNEAYASLLEIGFVRPPLVPGLGLLLPR